MFRQVRIVNGSKYIYVDQSFRIGSKVKKASFYLGKENAIEFNDFSKLNKASIEKVAKARTDYIRKNKKSSLGSLIYGLKTNPI